ncbi:uncharacterized protein LOC135493433 [Lineus longissimus]|uniref:uncharacterized protein LOC135493433 n=1 Tax=Lineus longissimus TaxID=88925 RepID=UPI002B4E62CC
MTTVVEEGVLQRFSAPLWRKTNYLQRWRRIENMVLREEAGGSFTLHKADCSENSASKYNFWKVEVRPSNPTDTKKTKDFLGFELLLHMRGEDEEEDKEWIPFRCESLQEQRRWMISLGYTGDGMFSNGDPHSQPLESWVGKWDVIHPAMMTAQVITAKTEQQEKRENPGGGDDPTLPSYNDVMEQTGMFSIEFAMQMHRREHCGDHPAPPPLPPVLQHRRPVDDSVLPPHGPPIFWPVSIGFGKEIRLPDDIQLLWDANLNRNVFLDHKTQIVTWIDPRPPLLPPPNVEKQMILYGDTKRGIPKEPNSMSTFSYLYSFAQSVRDKPHGLEIKAEGIPGSHGRSGQIGSHGYTGAHGSSGFGSGGNGHPGGPGGPGGPGERGQDAVSGTHASDLQVHVGGDTEKLQISGTVTEWAYLGGLENEHVVFLNARGGDGGHGGAGGQGGHGGTGGQGGKGARGRDGHSSHSTGGRGGNGGPGGNGGDGGFGGPGGPGGDGGHAGDSGMGGNVQVSAYDPRIFMLIGVDACPGTKGNGGRRGDGGFGGKGGHGGSGGSGGHGGRGGPAGENRSAGSSGSSGSHGRSGHSGGSGLTGSAGNDGNDGQTGETGSILWTVLDPTTKAVLCQTGVRYEILTLDYVVTSEVNDGIFEPNEKIFVNGLVVQNVGEMYCPDGAEVTFKSTQTVNFVPAKYVLPVIESAHRFDVPETYVGRIFDVPCPNSPGAYKGSAEVISRVHMLNRPFDSGFRKVTLDVQYPIKLESINAPSQMGRGEENFVHVTLKNISTMPYGDGMDSGGFLEVRVRLDRRILPVAKQELMENQPYMLTFHPATRDSVHARIYHIAPNSTLTVTLPIYMEGGAELFDRCLVQADVFLRGKLIEYNQHLIRVCPYYVKRDPPADVLLVTGPEITRPHFILWQTMFEMLDVTLDFWDVERYNGMSLDSTTSQRHPVTWLDRYGGRMILYPFNTPQNVLGEDIVSHFYRGGDLSEDQDSSVLLLTNNRDLADPKVYMKRMNEELTRWQPAVDLGNRFGGKHLFHPEFCACCCCSNPAKRKAKSILKKLEERNSMNSYILYSKTVNYEKRATFTYDYGSLDVRSVPLHRGSNFHLVNNELLLQLGLDDVKLTPAATEIPLGSNFGQVLLMVILNLPLHAKTHLLESGQSDGPKRLLTTPNGAKFTLRRLTVMSLEEYLCFEIMAKPRMPARFELLVQEIQNNGQVYAAEDIAPYVYLSAAAFVQEAKKCSGSYKSRARDLYKELHSSLKRHGDKAEQKEARSAAESMLDDKVRVTYKMLLRQDYLHHCHRLRVKDKMYDLSKSGEMW